MLIFATWEGDLFRKSVRCILGEFLSGIVDVLLWTFIVSAVMNMAKTGNECCITQSSDYSSRQKWRPLARNFPSSVWSFRQTDVDRYFWQGCNRTPSPLVWQPYDSRRNSIPPTSNRSLFWAEYRTDYKYISALLRRRVGEFMIAIRAINFYIQVLRRSSSRISQYIGKFQRTMLSWGRLTIGVSATYINGR